MRPQRSTVTLRPTADAPEAVSTFADPLAELFVVDAQGAIWKGTMVRPGTPSALAALLPGERKRFLAALLKDAGPRLRERLMPLGTRTGWYFAKSAGSAGLIDAGPGLTWHDDQVIVMGPLS